MTYTPASALSLGDYIWRVRAIDQDNNEGPWATASTGFSIEVNSAPSNPVLNNYNTGSATQDTTPTFNFDLNDANSGDLIKYQIQIDNDYDFSSPIVDFTEASYTAAPR